MKAFCRSLRARPNLSIGLFGALLMFGPSAFAVIAAVGVSFAVRAFPDAEIFQRLSGVLLKTVLSPTGAKSAVMLGGLGLFVVGFSIGRACWKRWPRLGE